MINKVILLIIFAISATSFSATMLADSLADSTAIAVKDSSFFAWHADSTLTTGSSYGSFADILQDLPGGYYFNHGSVGQPAYGFFFSGIPSMMRINCDGLLLDDPLSGGVDLNLIPTEAVQQLYFFPNPLKGGNGFWANSQTLYIRTRDLSGQPIRSRVAYRTGAKSYNDVDARFGIQASQRLRINMGGSLKSYGELYAKREKYRAQQVNVNIEQYLGRDWWARYLLLRNRFEPNLLLPQPLANYPGLDHLHQKETRYDHGFMLQKGRTFSTAVQLSDYDRSLHSDDSNSLNQHQDVFRALWHSLWQKQIAFFTYQLGGDWQWTRLKSRDWGKHEQQQVGGWGGIVAAIGAKWSLSAGVRGQKLGGSDLAWLPYFQTNFNPSPDWQWIFWAERILTPASFASRFSTGPFALGQADLRNERCDALGLGMEKQFIDGKLLMALSWSSITDGILTEIRQGENVPVYRNQPKHDQVAVDLAGEWRPFSWISLSAQGKQLFFASFQPDNWPATSGQGYLQLNHIFFKSDLDVRIRFGCMFFGERRGPDPIFCDNSFVKAPLTAIAVPYVHGIFVIKDVTLFLAIQNPLSQPYQITYGYPMPLAQFRWGFVWKFRD